MLVVGPSHDPTISIGGIDVHHGDFNFGNLRKRLLGHWCDHHHMKAHYDTTHSTLVFHAHLVHHGQAGHRCP